MRRMQMLVVNTAVLLIILPKENEQSLIEQ